MADEYFAATASDRIAGVLDEKVEDWIRFTQASAHFRKMRKSWHMYYGMGQHGNVSSSDIKEAGPRGQYSLMFVNEFRNALKHVHTMVTQQKIVYDCHGINEDAKTIESCDLASGLLDYYLRDKKVSRYLKQAAEYGLFLSEGFVAMDWDTTKGKLYTYKPGEDGTNQAMFDGDINFDVFTPLDVVKDHWRKDAKMPWSIVVRWKNRYDLAAKYPEKADDILSVDPEKLWKYREDFFNRWFYTDIDLIPEMTFQHERSPSLPQGRVVKFLDKNVLLFDGALPVEKPALFRIAPDNQADTCFGYSPAFDMLGVQDAANLLDSVIMTNQKTFGVGCVKLPEGHNLSHQMIAEGMVALVVNEKNGKMEPINFTSTPAEVFNYRQTLGQKLEVLSGINSVIKGQPDSNIGSGNFAALIASQAYQFSSGLQESYIELAQDVGQGIIEFLQTFPKSERTAAIVGKNKRYMMKNFTSDDLKGVQNVTVEIGNAAGKTVAGRMQLGKDLLDGGLITEVDHYIEVMETGRIEPMTNKKQTQNNLINRENELLRDGQVPPVMSSDNHARHIDDHKCLVDDPDIRTGDPKIMQAVVEHMLEHYKTWQSTDPSLLAVLGIPTFPGISSAPGQMPPPGAGPEAAQVDGTAPGMPSMPEPAKNPLDGQVPGGVPAQPITPAPNLQM